MTLSTIERDHNLMASSNPFQVRTFIRTDTVGALDGDVQSGGATQITVKSTPANDNAFSNTVVGDIVQVENEDMLVTSKAGTTILGVKRAYAGTVFGSPGYRDTLAVWTWKDITDTVGLDHGVDAVSQIKHSFEHSLNTFASSAATLQAFNKDGFWDRVTPPILGLTSYRHRWIRFYLHTHAGPAVDIRRLATMLIDDIETGDGIYAKIKLVGVGSLLRGETEASSTRQGREWPTYCPTPALVEMLLTSVDELRTNGTSTVFGIPLQTRRMLSRKFARTISLPSGISSISHHGKPNDWVYPSPLGGTGNEDTLMRNMGKRASGTNATSGNYTSAMAWDPQATGAGNVITGNPATVGRLYLGIAGDIWEFDPVSREGRRAVENAAGDAGGLGRRIYRLWYNPNDNATAGKPKIHGAAWTEYANSVTGTNYTERAVDGRMFRWIGGTSLASWNDISNWWPGTHCFRDGTPDGGQTYVGGGNTGLAVGENISLPFGQFVDGAAVGDAQLYGEIRQQNGDLDANGIGLPYRFQSTSRFGAANPFRLDPGIVHEAVDSDGNALTDNKAYWGVVGAGATSAAFRFTLGQQGCCALVASTSAWADLGAICYCEINTTTGIITLKAWEAQSATITTLKTFASPAEQPYSLAASGGDKIGAGQFNVFCGYVTWSEVVNFSRARIAKFDAATNAETTMYDSAADVLSDYYTPLWIGYNKNLTNAGVILVSWFKRDAVSTATAFNISGHISSGTFTSVPTTHQMVSYIHAQTQTEIEQSRPYFYALDTAGRLMKIACDASTGVIDDTQNVVMDRGFGPVDGESWSATEQLAIKGTNQVFGVSAPVWNFGNDHRDGKRDGLFILWKLDQTLWDTFELGFFDKETVEQALSHVAFASNSVWGFDEGGNFVWNDRIQTSTPTITFGGGADMQTRISRRRGYAEIENPVEIAPWTLRAGTVNARVDLSKAATIESSSEPIEVQSPDNKQKVIVLTCSQSGRVGTAAFKAYVQAGTYKTYLTETYPGGVATSVVKIAFLGKAASGPYSELLDSDDRNRQLQIPKNSVIKLPDGTERTIVSLQEISEYNLQLSILPWTPAVSIFAGSPCDIDLTIGTMGAVSTTVFYPDTGFSTENPDGYVLTSSRDWQEIGGGEQWATGCLVRFGVPPDLSGYQQDMNYGETGWIAGDRIVIEVSGIDLVANNNAKVSARDGEAIRKYGRRNFSTDKGKMTPRKAIYIAEARLAQNKAPRWIYTVDTFLSPHVKLFDRHRVYDPKLIRTAPYTDDVTVRMVQHNINTGRTIFEAIGSVAA